MGLLALMASIVMGMVAFQIFRDWILGRGSKARELPGIPGLDRAANPYAPPARDNEPLPPEEQALPPRTGPSPDFFGVVNQNLPFLGGQAEWDLGPPPPSYGFEHEEGDKVVQLSAEELRGFSSTPGED